MKLYNSRRPQLKSRQKGMTLLEIVIVLGIIALIMGAGIGAFGGIMAGANEQATRMKMQGLKTQLESYKLLGGMYPTEAKGLKALVDKPTVSPAPRRWKQQISAIPFDPWQGELVYKFPGSKDRNSPEIISKGEDGELGTEDDLSSQDEL